MLRIPRIPKGSLRHNFAWVFVGNSALAFSQWFVLVALVKWGSTATAGQFGISLAISGPVMMFANMNLRALQATDVARRYHFSEYYGLRFVTSLVAATVIVGIGELWYWASDLSEAARACIWAMALYKFFESQSDIVFGSLQQREDMDGIGKSQVLKTLVIVCGVGLVAYVTGSAVWVVLCMAVARAVCFYAYDLPLALRGERWQLGWNPLAGIDWGRFRQLFWSAIPLGVVMLLLSLNTNVPRYFLMHHADEKAIGIFLGLSYLPMVFGRVFLALGQAASPRLSRHFQAQEYGAFRRLLYRLLAASLLLGVSLTVVCYLLGGWILRWVYAPEFAPYNLEFAVVTLASAIGFMASFMGVGMTAMGQIRRQPWILGCVLIVQVAFCLWCVPSWGLLGAAMSLVAANLAQLVLMGLNNYWELRQRCGVPGAAAFGLGS